MDAASPDEALMLAYRNGDAAAFEVLYRRHRGPLFRFILRQCGVTAVAEELFQDVWMSLINARDGYEVKAKFTTWLYQVARNRVIDHHRRRRLREAPPDPVSEMELENVPAPANQQPERRLQADRELETILRLVDALPDEQRTAFLLREEAGMDLDEIAAVTGVNAETAKSRLRYAVRKLRAGLGDGHE